jgi:hypothetical protein
MTTIMAEMPILIPEIESAVIQEKKRLLLVLPRYLLAMMDAADIDFLHPNRLTRW